MPPTIFDSDFFDDLRFDEQLFRIFECLTDVQFFVKDRRSRLMACNAAHRHNLFRFVPPGELFGKSIHDFFPPSLASAFAEDDEAVMASGQPLRDRVELNVTPSGTLAWFSTSKFPLRDSTGQIVGLLGVCRRLRAADERLNPFSRMQPAIEHIEKNYREEIEVEALAKLCHLSVPHFHREFKKCFRMTPLQFLIRLRIHDACNRLGNDSLSVGEVAYRCGFSDQNYFARQFKKVMGITPSRFRERRHVTKD